MYHEHPLRIMRYSMKSIWLLIFPLLRGAAVFRFDTASFYAWIQGAWKDVAILGIILLFGFIRWYFSKISITESAVVYKSGLFMKVTKSIPVENISAVTSERLFILVPLKAMTFKCDTRAGLFNSTDMELLVTTKVGEELMSHIPKPVSDGGKDDFPEPTLLSVLLFSAFFSSGFSGAVYIATFFYKGGDIAHDIVSVWLERITETTEKISEKFILGIPRTAIVIGTFFLGAWLLSFIVNVLRYSRFRVSADRKYLNVSCGITNRKEYRIRTDHINYTDLRQNLIMKLCNAVSVNISCAGYGSSGNQLPVIMPMRKEDNLGYGLEKIGISSKKRLDFRPKVTSIMSYIWLPFTCVIAVYVLYATGCEYFPQLSELLYFVVIMGEIPLVWLTAVKVAALFRSGITIDDEKIIVRCTKMTAFHTVIAENRKAVIVEIRQSPFQRIFKKKCHVRIWFTAESKARFTVKSLSVKDAEKICNLL